MERGQGQGPDVQQGWWSGGRGRARQGGRRLSPGLGSRTSTSRPSFSPIFSSLPRRLRSSAWMEKLALLTWGVSAFLVDLAAWFVMPLRPESCFRPNLVSFIGRSRAREAASRAPE